MPAARRRLLGMLTILETAAIALAVLRIAALWVRPPPSIMLIGYALLSARRRTPTPSAPSVRRKRARQAHGAGTRPRAGRSARHRGSCHSGCPGRPGRPAGARRALRGRGPRLRAGPRGEDTTSNAEVAGLSDGSDEDYRDEYPLKRLRAVGD